MHCIVKQTVLLLLGLASLVALADDMPFSIIDAKGEPIPCEDQFVVMNYVRNVMGGGEESVTIQLNEDIALTETLDFSWVSRHMILDLNQHVLMASEENGGFDDCLLNIELESGRSFKLQNGTVTGARQNGAIRIAAGQRVLIESVTFKNNHCDGNQDMLWEGDVGGAIRCNSNLKLVGCTFCNNSCTTHGGAVGLYSNDYQSRYVIENCTFENNTAGEAGGALFIGCSGQIQNTIIRNNTVTGRDDGATVGQNDITVGQGGGVYLTRHGGVSYGDESEGFWWGRFEGPTMLIEEGVEITDNTASPQPGTAAQTNNLYLARNWNLYCNAAVMVSGDTNAETRVGLTLSTDNGDGVFTRLSTEEGGEAIDADFSAWFFGDKSWLRPTFDDEAGCLSLNDLRVAPGGEVTFKANSAEAAARLCVFWPPSDVAAALSEADKIAYSGMFAPVATLVTNKTWSVRFALTAEAKAALQKTVDDAQPVVLAAALAGRQAELDVLPGFYYTIKNGPTVSLGRNDAGKLATGPKLPLGVPVVEGSSAFFRTTVSELPIPAQGMETSDP